MYGLYFNNISLYFVPNDAKYIPINDLNPGCISRDCNCRTKAAVNEEEYQTT